MPWIAECFLLAEHTTGADCFVVNSGFLALFRATFHAVLHYILYIIDHSFNN